MNEDFLKTESNTRIIHFNEKTYSNFGNFYFENKKKIYDEIIRTYEILVNSDEEYMFLDFNVRFEDFIFKPSVKYGYEKIDTLEKIFLPFFVEKEDYEMCDRIKKILDKTKNPSN